MSRKGKAVHLLDLLERSSMTAYSKPELSDITPISSILGSFKPPKTLKRGIYMNGYPLIAEAVSYGQRKGVLLILDSSWRGILCAELRTVKPT
jgi:hypothetical protein